MLLNVLFSNSKDKWIHCISAFNARSLSFFHASPFRVTGVLRLSGGDRASSALLAARVPNARHPAPCELLVPQNPRLVLLRPMPSARSQIHRRRGAIPNILHSTE